MTKFSILVLSPAVLLGGLDKAGAQVLLDVSKITCEQYVGYKITNPRNIAIWLSGYHKGKTNSTVLDTQLLNSQEDKLRDYCLTRPKTMIIEATETLFIPK